MTKSPCSLRWGTCHAAPDDAVRGHAGRLWLALLLAMMPVLAATVTAAAAEPPALTVLDSPEAARAAQQAWATYLGRPVEYANTAGMSFVLVPPGTFTMGCGDEDAPLHRVTVTRPFYLAKTEVTQAQWQKVMGTKRSTYFAGADQPVNFITWYDAEAFRRAMAKLEPGAVYRLPTEAEWELAARGGAEGDAGHAGLDATAWTWENGGQTTHPVGQKAANALGLYDMQGNVWEWCSDFYEPAYYTIAPGSDPAGPQASLYGYRVLRGGSVFYPVRAARLGNRGFYQSSRSERTIGFRPVLEMPAVGEAETAAGGDS